jgi:hypothetical protein
MVVVVLSCKAQLADYDLCTNDALELCLEVERSFATVALEGSVIACMFELIVFLSCLFRFS